MMLTSWIERIIDGSHPWSTYREVVPVASGAPSTTVDRATAWATAPSWQNDSVDTPEGRPGGTRDAGNGSEDDEEYEDDEEEEEEDNEAEDDEDDESEDKSGDSE